MLVLPLHISKKVINPEFSLRNSVEETDETCFVFPHLHVKARTVQHKRSQEIELLEVIIIHPLTINQFKRPRGVVILVKEMSIIFKVAISNHILFLGRI